MIRPCLLAMGLLTRIPLPQTMRTLLNHATAEDHGRSILCYPFIGLLIGIILWGAALLLLGLSAPPMLSAALVTALWVQLTGGLHIDGLADCADAWVGGMGDRDRMLKIMKDPASGPAGVTAIVLLLLIKFSALSALFSHVESLASVKQSIGDTLLRLLQIDHLAAVMIMAPIMGRLAIVALILMLPYVNRNGMGAEAARHLPRSHGLSLLFISPSVPVLVFPIILPSVVIAVMSVFFHYGSVSSRMGGITGDMLGEVCEQTETVFLIGSIILLIYV